MKIRISLTLALGLLLLHFTVLAPAATGDTSRGHQYYNPLDSAIFLEKQQVAAQETTLTAQTLAVAKSFLGTPYVTGTLEGNAREQLVVNLRQLDCWTLVECSLAIAQTGDGGFGDYLSRLRQLRYWGGTIDGYGSRIHYFTGWLLQAEKSGLLSNLTRDLGGIPYRKKINYISARPAKYPRINKPETLRALMAAEKRINAHEWFYIPQSKINAIEQQIEDGDIILLTSAKRDLDIAHQGFAVRQNGHIHLLHASSLSKKVIISKQPLAQYVLAQKGQTGIMIARIKSGAD